MLIALILRINVDIREDTAIVIGLKG